MIILVLDPDLTPATNGQVNSDLDPDPTCQVITDQVPDPDRLIVSDPGGSGSATQKNSIGRSSPDIFLHCLCQSERELWPRRNTAKHLGHSKISNNEENTRKN
jgi:hypothetical protein